MSRAHVNPQDKPFAAHPVGAVEEYRQMYIEEAEKQFNLWMFRYPESGNDKSLLKVLEIMDEASNFMGTHPLNDPEHPVTEKQKEEYSNELRRIYAKLNDVRLF